jgi:hypothetical protein
VVLSFEILISGSQDEVICYWCEGELKGWERRSTPWREHSTAFPGCYLVDKKRRELQLNGITLLQGLSEPTLRSFASRLASFSTHPNPVEQRSGELAEAGFYYTGTGKLS